MHAVIVYYMLYRFDAFALFHDLEFPVWKVDVMTDVALIECLEMRFIPVIKFAQNIQYYISSGSFKISGRLFKNHVCI